MGVFHFNPFYKESDLSNFHALRQEFTGDALQRRKSHIEVSD